MSKKQFIIYLAVAFGTAYILEIIGGLYANKGNRLVFTLCLSVAMFMPLLGTLAAKFPFKGMGWIPRIKGNVKIIVFSLLAPAVCAILGAVIFYLVFPGSFDSELTSLAQTVGPEAYEAIKAQGLTPLLLILVSEISAVTYAAFINTFVAIGEETGWRGCMYPYLKERFGKMKGRIIGGIIWGAWHWPIMLLAGYEYGKDYIGAPVLGLVVFCIFTVAAGILLDHVYEKSGTIWMAALFHGAINANNVFPYTVKPEYSHLSILGPAFIGVISGLPLLFVAIYVACKDAKCADKMDE